VNNPTTPLVGSMRRDPVTGRLVVNGELACSGCAKPSAARFCSHICEVKRSAELRRLRTNMPPMRVWRTLPKAERGVR
jgi:hypothetical protein